MSADSDKHIAALAKVTESNYFDLSKPAHREAFRTVTKLAEKKLEQEPLMAKTEGEVNRKLLNVIIWSLAITVTVAVLVNAYNHKQSLDVERLRLEQQK